MLLIIIICVILSGYFSATETAFSAINRVRIRNQAEKGNKRAALVLQLSDNYDSLLSTILIGNNIVNIGCSSLATILFVKLLGEEMGAGISTLVITVVVLIFGEISPKSIAKESPEKFAMFSAPMINGLRIVLTPINWMFGQWKKLLSCLFKTSGSQGITSEELFTIVEEAQEEGSIDKEEGSLLPEFQEDEILPVLGIDTLVKKTKPQPIFTEASLLAAMEGCGRTLDDEKEKEAMEDSGLGTPATRAGIIELLIARHYVERNGRSLIPTPKGLEVYDIVKEKMIANVSMTGGWECALHEIETGKVSTETFTQSINSYTQQITSELLALKLNHPDLPHCNCPKCGAETIIVFNKVAKCSDPNCGFLLFRTFNGRELTDNQMLLLLSGKRTGYLKFTSKKGKKYEASLELDDNYRIEMTFKDNKPKK